MIFEDCDPVACALESVDSLGLNIKKVGLFRREWEDRLGVGDPVDSVEYFSPQPRVSEIHQSYSVSEGGTIKRGDIMVKMLSKNIYPSKDMINCSSEEENIELYYFIDNELYEVIEVREKIVYWNVLVRKAKKRTLFLES